MRGTFGRSICKASKKLFRISSVPEEWKRARVTPIPKKGSNKTKVTVDRFLCCRVSGR